MPYDADLADQRARYGDGLLRRAPEQLERQQTYEHEAAARVEEARRIREAEKVKLQEAEVSRKLMPVHELTGRLDAHASLKRKPVRLKRSVDWPEKRPTSGNWR